MRRLLLKDKICLAIATLFGAGYLPLASGTGACIIAVFIFMFVKSEFYFLIITALSLALSYACSTRAEKIYNEKDCKKIVIDDFCGMLISLLFIPHDIKFIVIAFFLFRALDVVKIPPADTMEKFSGAKGIVGDDVVAGIYTNLILQILRLALKISS
jgi:phosphatidylglycerophosphatase A